ncbi:hypothetical protein HYH03_001373 [Edaphochlamys debaryana]|uniref:CHASE domain-containing protein n=1 Tax=Edaphochlamys debaryana TaxID=47281 RepID=A0A836C577_9CHLO|nr:hypothetical protein HYH03_001373 [Edaphochlamys debaryana]|eukprot:KAG2500605.1 hypothetical protein HYH03_001373 [Edaphochlamys debaryana]
MHMLLDSRPSSSTADQPPPALPGSARKRTALPVEPPAASPRPAVGVEGQRLLQAAAEGAFKCEVWWPFYEPVEYVVYQLPETHEDLALSTRHQLPTGPFMFRTPPGTGLWRQLFASQVNLPAALQGRILIQCWWEVQPTPNAGHGFWNLGSYRGAFLLIPRAVFAARPAVLAAPPPPPSGGPLPPPAATLPRPGAVYGSRLRARVTFMLPSLPEPHSQLFPRDTPCVLLPHGIAGCVTAGIRVVTLAPSGPGGSLEYIAHVLDPQPGPGLGLLVAFYSIIDRSTDQGLFLGAFLVVPEWAAGQVDAMQLGTGGTQGGPGRGGRGSENGEHDPSNDGAGGGPGTAGGDGGGGSGGPGWAPSGGVWGFVAGDHMQRSAEGGAPHGQAHGLGGGGTAAAADAPASEPPLVLHMGVAVLAVAASAACFCLWPALVAALGVLVGFVVWRYAVAAGRQAWLGSRGPAGAQAAFLSGAGGAGAARAEGPAERPAADEGGGEGGPTTQLYLLLISQRKSLRLPAHASPGPSPFALAPTAVDPAAGGSSTASLDLTAAKGSKGASATTSKPLTVAPLAPKASWRQLCAAVLPYVVFALLMFMLLGRLAHQRAQHYTLTATQDQHNRAADVAGEAARSVERVLDRLISPLHALVSHVRLDPRWDRVNASFPAVAQSINDVTPFYELELCPLGLVGAISVPWLDLTGEARWRMYQDLDFGLDMMDPERPSFPLELDAVTRDGSVVIMGPWYAPAGELADGAYAVRYSIWQPPGEWEQTMPTPNSIAACPAAVCTRPDGLRWWGWANAVFAFRHVLQRLAPLADRGLLYSLEPDPRSTNQSMLATSERLPNPIACERVEIDVYGAYTWTLCVQPAAGFEPAWGPWLMAGLLVAAAIGSCILALALGMAIRRPSASTAWPAEPVPMQEHRPHQVTTGAAAE